MEPKDLRATLARVKPGPVKVVLSAKKAVPGIPSSGLWPRVTLKLDDRVESVALTEYADVKKKAEDSKKLTKLEIAILRLCGVESRAMRAVKSEQGVNWELREAVKRVRQRISSAISQAQTTAKLGTRIERVQRKSRRSTAEEVVKESFRRLLQGTVKVNDLTPAQVGNWWREVRNEKIVQEVHEL